MKRVLRSFILTAVLLAGLASCACAAGKTQIGVAVTNFNDKWLSYLVDAMREQAKKYPDYEFVFADGNEDAGKQIGQVEDFISSGVKGVVLIAVNTDTAAPMTKACRDAKIPLITVNRLLSNQEEATAYVGSDSAEAGLMEAEAVFEKTGGKGNVAVLYGVPGNESAVKRTAGYHEAAKKYPAVKFVAEEIGNYYREEGMKITENWLQSGLDFNIILSNNDEMAIGAILAMEGQGVRNKYIIAGVDATPDALQFMKEGRLDVTVFQDAKGQGVAAVDTVVKAVKGTLTEKIVWVPYEPVTPDKVDKYIAKWK